MRRLAFLGLGLGLSLTACSGGDDPGVDAGPVGDAGPVADAGNRPDAGGPLDTGVVDDGKVSITGRVLRLDGYLTGQNVALNGAQISALGVVGVDRVSSQAPLGTYEIRVPTDGTLILSATALDNWSSYESVTVGTQNVEGRDFLMAYEPYLERISSAHQVTYNETFACHAPNVGNCEWSIVMGRVVDDGTLNNGTPAPLGDFAKDDFIIRVEQDANWYTKGPYFLFPTGQPDPNGNATRRVRNSQTNLYQGGLFYLFVEVPVGGPQSVNVELSGASNLGGEPNNRYFGPVTIPAFRGAFTWGNLPETGNPPVIVPPPPPVDVDFAQEVYPLFQPVELGGYGCQGCHTSIGQQPAGGLDLSGGPANAYAGLNPANYPQRVNVQNPQASLLLTKPLYEVAGPQNHPIFAFLSEQDAGYLTVQGWIAGGAIYEGGPPPPPVSFYNDIRPILYEPAANGGAGCYSCHVQGVDETNAPGGAYFGGDGNALYQVLTQDTPSDNGLTGEQYRINKQGNIGNSLLLLNPTAGTPEPHPSKPIQGANDLRYQLIYQWISQGYVNDTP